MKKHILQIDEKDCGAASFAMICAHYGKRLPVSRAKKLVCTDSLGTNMQGIIDGAEAVGLHAEGLNGSYEDLLESISSKQVSFPFIARILKDNKLEHYIVVRKITPVSVYISDPDEAKFSKITVDEFKKIWLHDLISFEKTESFRKNNEVFGVFRRYFHHIGNQKKMVFVVLLISFLLLGIGVVSSLVMGKVFTNLLAISDSEYARFRILCIWALSLFVFSSVMEILSSLLQTAYEKRINRDISKEIMDSVVNSDMNNFDKLSESDYLSRVFDYEKIKYFVSGIPFVFLENMILLLGSGIVLLIISWKLFAILIVALILYAVIILSFARPIKRTNRDIVLGRKDILAEIEEVVAGFTQIKSFRAEKPFRDRVALKIDRYEGVRAKDNNLNQLRMTLISLVNLSMPIAFLWYGKYCYDKGTLTLGSILLFYYLSTYFTTPAKQLLSVVSQFHYITTAVDRINDLYQMDAETDQSENKVDMSAPVIRMEHIRFRYGNRDLVLDDLTMCISKYHKIAITGENGCGKSTLAKLLVRFYDYESGEIWVNNRSIREYSLEDLRKKTCYISQKDYLFADTIMNNIRMGDESISDDIVMKACQVSCADEVADSMSGGYNAVLDANGSNLSAGQRQRIILARALAHSPEILIMDECTANIDAPTTEKIFRSLDNMNNTMFIVVTHEKNVISECDYCIMIKNGKAVREGIPQEVLKGY